MDSDGSRSNDNHNYYTGNADSIGGNTMNKDTFMALLKERDFKSIISIFRVMNEVDIASLLSELEGKQLAQAFRLIPKDKAADVFIHMNTSVQAGLIEIFTEAELKDIFDDIFMDDTVDLLDELPANVVTRILNTVSKEKRARINQLLQYPDDSAGSIMTTEYVSLKKHMTVAQALAHIKQVGIHKETIYTCYVLEHRRLVGIVTAKDLMTMNDDTQIGAFMEKEIICVRTHDDKEEVAKLFSKYDLLAMPVLDKEDLMVGIVTVDDAMDVMVDEATEDISLMAAVSPGEKSYFEMSIFDHAKSRVVWLLILMLSASITGAIITQYEEAFSALPILVSFIPMLMDTGGNCGSQSSTLIIRGLALDQITFKDTLKVLFKEFRISLLVSVILAVVNAIRIYFTYGHNLTLSIVIGLTLIATVVISKLIGCMLPLFAKKVHLDPAIMAAPIITTLVDTCSIIIYFSIATQAFHL